MLTTICNWLVVSTHLKNISQNGFIFPNFRGENKKSLKPPQYATSFYPNCRPPHIFGVNKMPPGTSSPNFDLQTGLKIAGEIERLLPSTISTPSTQHIVTVHLQECQKPFLQQLDHSAAISSGQMRHSRQHLSLSLSLSLSSVLEYYIPCMYYIRTCTDISICPLHLGSTRP